jgi:hypothetical protein
MARPLVDLRGPVRALFSDVDGTMTTGHRIEAATYAAIDRLHASGLPLVMVTGRGAGFGLTYMQTMPIQACVTENGGVTFLRDGKRIRKLYGVPEATLPDWRRRMFAAVDEIRARIPGAQLSTDSAYREVDLALDWNEEIQLPQANADVMVTMLRAAGLTATRSSVHVNFGPPEFDKATACLAVVEHLYGAAVDLSQLVYVGDAMNDAPMFAKFPTSVGVANIKQWWDELPAKPAYLTERAESAGLRELIDHLLTLPRA